MQVSKKKMKRCASAPPPFNQDKIKALTCFKHSRKGGQPFRATQLRLDAELEIPAGEEQALAEFAHQLQKHVSRLRERADAKRAEAAALRGSDEDGDQLERDAEDLP